MKRKFKEIRESILQHLKEKSLTNMELSKELKADYRTINKHLIWLLGMEKIEKIKRNKKVYYKLTKMLPSSSPVKDMDA